MKRSMLKKVISIGLVLGMSLSLVGCGQAKTEKKDESSKKTITIGGTSISEVTYEAIKPVFEKEGFKTKFVMFDANPVVLEACNSKEVDMALGQHREYVKSFDSSNNADLQMVKPYGYYTGIGLYSDKYKNIKDIPNGGKIAIMNDAMNMNIALRILEENGLIKINKDVKTATIADITSNPKNLKIVDMDQAQTVTALKDMDAACVFFTHMSNAGLDPTKYLARDTQMIKYPMGVIVKKENVNSDWAVAFAKCFKDKTVQDKINKAFPGVFEFYENDKQAD
ncbi:MAG: methionine-binding protein [Lachnospiraceae bacterium]|jgi:D-methionine transport system substrate-binding protein|nr:methionine-binding protein [Lachnospiraceae bacterium]